MSAQSNEIEVISIKTEILFNDKIKYDYPHLTQNNLIIWIIIVTFAQKHLDYEIDRIYISNAKTLFQDFYHRMQDTFLQFYLNDFCYKFSRIYFGDKIFYRLMIAAVDYKPTFEHKIYYKKMRIY